MSKSNMVCIRMSDEFREWLEKEAAKEGVTASEFVRFLILKAMVKS